MRIINDILDLSSVESGKIRMSPVPVSPSDAPAGDRRAAPSARGRTRRLHRTRTRRGPAPLIQTDPTRVRQVLLNLISNALKFTEHGEIHLAINRAGQVLRIDVTDTGIGMDEEHAISLFEPFTQADVSASRRYGGTGLGLAISRRISRLLGGDLILLRTEPGVGSRFRFTIPVEEAAGEDYKPAPKNLPATEVRRHERALTGRRILVVDDGRDNRLLLSRLLGRVGAEVICAGDGQEGVEAAVAAEQSGKPFDHILMDIHMPVLDGLAAVAELRRRGVMRPIIALTANAMPGTRERCLAAGCQGYLVKPIDRRAILELLACSGRGS